MPGPGYYSDHLCPNDRVAVMVARGARGHQSAPGRAAQLLQGAGSVPAHRASRRQARATTLRRGPGPGLAGARGAGVGAKAGAWIGQDA
jgi:hypothetical protein